MLVEPICNRRACKHFMGMIEPDGTEMTERPVCEAFPNGIPYEIAWGPNKHATPLPGQGNDIVFEEIKPGEEQEYFDKFMAWPRPGVK